ncbi:MAG TPA: TetR/AcrR family transcriptional regulator [Acetobacteraceae bacterium]|jgi:AcrR family transcriptional regulator|nr:TetR/AcrR family transcriptional regulator [Acetobacteraceae bacterium]
MVQKESARRGRPRSYDPDTALAQAMTVFWRAGYSGTSLDDITAGTGLNRPSLYGAFGDKHALYLQTLERYWQAGRAGLAEALSRDVPLREALRRVYERALSLYLPSDDGARGCFLIGTALTEAALDADVRKLLRDALHDFDSAFEERIRYAREQGQLPRNVDTAGLARMASAALHTLAIRSRMGEPRKMLEATIDAALDLICGTTRPEGSRRPRPAPVRTHSPSSKAKRSSRSHR